MAALGLMGALFGASITAWAAASEEGAVKLALAPPTAVPVTGQGPGSVRAPEAPARVVSINLCTDQLAMLVAGRGQLLSVSFVASDPLSSAMVEEAAAYHTNHALAEEIYLMKPDLVLAGRYNARATVNMLERLGIPVVTFDPAQSLEDVSLRLREMGAALGREARAAKLVADFEARLSAYQREITARPRAALYYANGYTSGDRTLAGQILGTAGLANVAAEEGFSTGGVIPLEVLALAEPDAVITSRPYPAASRSEEVLAHPVIEVLRSARPDSAMTDSDWVCGTPHVLNAIADMAALRRDIVQGGP